MLKRIQVIDSHTGGEPTRIVIDGGPDLGDGPLSERVALFRDNHDEIRSAVVHEPRGSDVLVGGLICEPTDPKFACSVIFFDNVGYLGMCGHGTIGFIELFGPAEDVSNASRNFVLCPGGAYDRSPCGTGLSAKLACLAADEKLAPGASWRQEGILGSVFVGSYQLAPDSKGIIPTITGTAFVCSEASLILDPADPFCMGIGQ